MLKAELVKAREDGRTSLMSVVVYGADKVCKQMKRERITVARCTVERLMKHLGS